MPYKPPSTLAGSLSPNKSIGEGEDLKKRLMRAEVSVGFQSLKETYISDVTCLPYSKVEVRSPFVFIANMLPKRPEVTRPICAKQAISSDSSLFSKLNSHWRFTSATPYSSPTNQNKPFAPLPPDPPYPLTSPHDYPACWVDFYIAFEFKSPLYAAVANSFFEDVCKTMVGAFERRAEAKFGPPHKLAKTLRVNTSS